MTETSREYTPEEVEEAKVRYATLMRESEDTQKLAAGMLAARRLHLAYRFLLRRQLKADEEPPVIEDMIDDVAGQIAMNGQVPVDDLINELASVTLPVLAQAAAIEKQRAGDMARNIIDDIVEPIPQSEFTLRVPMPVSECMLGSLGAMFTGTHDVVYSFMHEMHRVHRVPNPAGVRPTVVRIVSNEYGHLTALNKVGGWECCVAPTNWANKTSAQISKRLNAYAGRLAGQRANVLLIDDLTVFLDIKPRSDTRFWSALRKPFKSILRWAESNDVALAVGVPTPRPDKAAESFAALKKAIPITILERGESQNLVYTDLLGGTYDINWGVLQDNATEKLIKDENLADDE